MNELNQILKIVSQVTGESEMNILSHCRKKEYSESRQLCAYACYQFTKSVKREIAHFLGGRDHSSIDHMVKTIKNLIDTEFEIQLKWTKIKSELLFAEFKVVRTDRQLFEYYKRERPSRAKNLINQ